MDTVSPYFKRSMLRPMYTLRCQICAADGESLWADSLLSSPLPSKRYQKRTELQPQVTRTDYLVSLEDTRANRQTDTHAHRNIPFSTGGGTVIQEAQLSPRDRAMRRVNWNLASCHATVQKLLIRQVLTKSMVWSWRFSRRQCVIDNVHSTMTRSSRLPLSQVS